MSSSISRNNLFKESKQKVVSTKKANKIEKLKKASSNIPKKKQMSNISQQTQTPQLSQTVTPQPSEIANFPELNTQTTQNMQPVINVNQRFSRNAGETTLGLVMIENILRRSI